MLYDELMRQNRELQEQLAMERQISFLKEMQALEQQAQQKAKILTGPEQRALESSLAEYLDDDRSSELEDY
ncbi:MAG: hypothetical protein ACLR6B_04310 [Blautia sp.]